jgi:dephospho-CoA kinase
MGRAPRASCARAAVSVEVALGIAGRIGSGKTSLSASLADRLRCPRASFGDYVRSIAIDRGLDAGDRRVLQDTGDDLIAAGWRTFCEDVLRSAGYAGGVVVVDGIRHADASQMMRTLVSPTPWLVVAVRSEDATRWSRLASRGFDDAGTTEAESHPNEREVKSVIASADLVVSSESSLMNAVEVVMGWLGRP